MDVYVLANSLREIFEVTSGSVIIIKVICSLNVSSEMAILCAYNISKCDFSKENMQLSVLFLELLVAFLVCINSTNM